MKKLVKILIAVVILAAAAVAAWIYFKKPAEEAPKISFRSEKIAVDNVRRTISATGTVEPEELVNVGAQVNGKIMSFGKDAEGKSVDYGSKITKGIKVK